MTVWFGQHFGRIRACTGGKRDHTVDDVRQSKETIMSEESVRLQDIHPRERNSYVHLVKGHWERAKVGQIQEV